MVVLGGWVFLMSEVPLYWPLKGDLWNAWPQHVGNLASLGALRAQIPTQHSLSFRSFRFFELPTQADTGNCSVERPCFLSDHIRPHCTEYRGNRLKGILTQAYELGPGGSANAGQRGPRQIL